MNIKNKLKNKKGFTLAELILTVLIIIILFGVGFLALFQIKKDIEQKRLDSLAQVIFTTSQNQIQKMKAAGQDEKFSPDETGSYAYPIVTTPGQKAVFYYVTSADRDKGVAASILPADSIDAQIRDYNWAIEYNPEIGYVYAVFYWEKDEAGPYDTTTFDPLRDFETRRKDALVGYYGGTTIEQSDTEKLSPTIEIHNGEKLTATLFCENRNFSDTLTFTVTITDQSGHTQTKVIPRAEMQVLGVEWSYELVLDDLTSSGTQFKNLWSDLTPGENITIKLSVGSSNPKVRTGSAEGVTNSLFGDGTTADTAEVMFGRHLQNLDLTTSGTTTAITTAVQKQNISFADDLNNEDDWATVYKNKTFKPINNSNLVSYTGSFTPDTGTDKLYTTINGLTITNADNAGLFGKVDSGKVLALTDVKLTGASVNGTTNAGTFIGQVSGNATLTGCQVYLTYTDTDKVYIQAPNAGGLIGAAASGSNITITESFAATEVGAAGNTYAGGLIGACAGTLSIDKSYADCYLLGQNVGGLVGRSAAGSAITISTSYAAGFAEGSASAAGMVNGPVSTINNAYTALGYTFPDNTTGYNFYPVAASGTAANTYYLDISGITKQGNINTITPKTSSELADQIFVIAGFSKADNNTTSHPYNFRELALSNYPYLKLLGIPHYGDWLEPFAEGRLCYFEKYQDNSFGFYGSGINALKAGEYVKGDGYGFIFESDNPNSLPHITITYYTADGSTASLTIKGDKKTPEYPSQANGTYTVTPIPITKDNKTYYLMPLPEIVYNTGYASPDFYQPLKINKSTGNTGTETYYYNPHFAKTQRQTDVCPSVVEGTVTEIRSAKHLYNLSKYNDVYAASSEKGIFLQMNPIDYELYDWTYYGKRGDVTSPVSVQTPIGGSSSAGATPTGFLATYDGGCLPIYNISFETPGDYVGMFGMNKGTIVNVVLADTYDVDNTANNRHIKKTTSTAMNESVFMGPLAAWNEGTIRNCAVAGVYQSGNYSLVATEGRYYCVGGLAGCNLGTIANCSADTPVLTISSTYGNIYAGGLVGSNDTDVNRGLRGTITNSYATGHINVVESTGTVRVSGFTASSSGTISNSYAAFNTTTAGNAVDYAFAPTGSPVNNCYYLYNGTYKYINQYHEYSTTRGLGTRTVYADMPASGIDQAHSLYNTVDGKVKAYPFEGKVKNAAGELVHYGNWPDKSDLGQAGMFYWEKEEGGNAGYKLTFIGKDDTGILLGSNLCDSHNDGGIITDYGYGFFVKTGMENNLTVNWSSNVALNSANGGKSKWTAAGTGYSAAASAELQANLAGYTFYAYKYGTGGADSKLYLTTKDANGTVELKYNNGSDIVTYNYAFNPFFGDALQYKGMTGVNDNETYKGQLEKYYYAPGTADNPYQTRNVAQLQFINWNYSSKNVSQVVTASNYKQFPYLLNCGDHTGQYDGSSLAKFGYSESDRLHWDQTHDMDAVSTANFYPIAAMGTSTPEKNNGFTCEDKFGVSHTYTNEQLSAIVSYAQSLYAWFGGHYDGQSYTVKNLTIDSSAFTVGLFGATAGAEIKNVIMYGDSAKAVIKRSTPQNNTGAYVIGGLIGLAYDYNVKNTTNYVTNCAIAGYTIEDSSSNRLGMGEVNIGGLIGVANIHLKNCSSVVDIVSKSRHNNNIGTSYSGIIIRIGGLAGSAQGNIINCYSGGTVDISANLAETPSGDYTDKAYGIYVGGIIGGVFTSTIQNFVDSVVWFNGSPNIRNCYTYMTLPQAGTVQNKDVTVTPIGFYGDRNGVPGSVIESVYNWMNTSTVGKVIKWFLNLPDQPSYGTVSIYNSYYDSAITAPVFAKPTDHRANVSYNGITPVSHDQMTSDALTGTNRIQQSNPTATKNFTSFTAALNSGAEAGGSWGRVTKSEGGASVDGKYSFPTGENKAVLLGKNYPFATVVTQPNLVYGGNANVHYGGWVIDGILWEKAIDGIDLIKDSTPVTGQTSVYKVQKNFKLSVKDIDAPANPASAITFAYGDGTAASSTLLKVLTDQISYDSGTKTYTVPIMAMGEGTDRVYATVQSSGQSFTASMIVTVAGELELKLTPAAGSSDKLEVPLTTGEEENTSTLNMQAMNIADTANPENVTEKMTWKVTGSVPQVIQTDVTKAMASGIKPADVKIIQAGEYTLNVDAIFTYQCDPADPTKTATFTKGDTIDTITVHKIKFLDTNDNPVSAQGGGTIADITGVLYGAKNVTAPADPALPTGQSFGGWYLDKTFTNKFVFGTTEVKDNLKLYANIGYVVTFNGNGGTFAESGTDTLIKVSAASEAIAEPSITRTHYTLDGWFKDEAFTQPFTAADFAAGVTAPITLYAKWTENDYINLTFMINGGEFVSGNNPQSDRVNKAYVGEAPQAEDAVFKATRGQQLDGWYMVNSNGDFINEQGTVIQPAKVAFDFTKVITDKSVGDKYVKAVWKAAPSFTVTFSADGGTFPAGSTQSVTVYEGENLESLNSSGAITIPVPTKSGFGFMGWKKSDGSDYVLNTPVTENLTLTAKWGTVNVIFASVEGAPDFAPTTKTIPYGGTMANISPMPTMTHYNLSWFKDNAYSVPADNNPIYENLTLYGTRAQKVSSGIVGVVKVVCERYYDWGTKYRLNYSGAYINFASGITSTAIDLSSYNVSDLSSAKDYQRTITIDGKTFNIKWTGGNPSGGSSPMTRYYWIVDGCTVNSSGNKVTGNDASASVTFTVSPDTDSYSISVP